MVGAAGGSEGPWATSGAPGRGLRVALVARREPGVTGTSRYVASLLPELRALGVDARVLHPRLPPGVGALAGAGRRAGMDLRSFFAMYPLRLQRAEVDLYHLTAQNLATLLVLQRFDRPVVVTVHDIIPYLVRHDRRLCVYRHPLHRLFDWLAMQGLKRADRLIADSRWTKRTLVEELGIPAERIEVVPLGVDRQRFRPVEVPEEFWRRYGLAREDRHILYVGSEDPRKNLETLVRAFALVRQRVPGVKLLKVGAPHFLRERERLRALVAELGLEGEVRFFDHVPEEDLPCFYNLAGVFAFPSLYEGFGLPVLEALACGTPVVAADTSAVAELRSRGVVLVEPSILAFAHALTDTVGLGRERAGQRNGLAKPLTPWQDSSAATIASYRNVRALRRRTEPTERVVLR